MQPTIPIKYSVIYTALFLSLSFTAKAETNKPENSLEQINVITELESFKATNKLKSNVNLSLLGEQLAFTSPITVINYDEQALADTQPRNIVDALAKTDASVMNFGGETNTLQGVYVRGLQLDARQFSLNGLAGLYSTYNSPTAAVSSAQLIKGASTATVGMDPEGSSGASINIETKRATDKAINLWVSLGLAVPVCKNLSTLDDVLAAIMNGASESMGFFVMEIPQEIIMMNATRSLPFPPIIEAINYVPPLITFMPNAPLTVDEPEYKIFKI